MHTRKHTHVDIRGQKQFQETRHMPGLKYEFKKGVGIDHCNNKLIPYTAKHSRGKTFAVFADFHPYHERFPVYVLHASGAYSLF